MINPAAVMQQFEEQDRRIATLTAENEALQSRLRECEANQTILAAASLGEKQRADAAEAKLSAVREIAAQHYNDPTYVRDDHSQNCRWCRVLKVLETE